MASDLDLTDEQRAEREAIAEKARQSARTSQLEDIRRVLATPEGRRVLFRFLFAGGLWRSSFDREPLVMARCEGRRELALEMLAELESAAPASLALMLQESKQ